MWRGINIYAMPGSMVLFNKYRKKDINIEIPIAKEKKKIPFYTFNESALNTFSEELAKERGVIKKIYQLEAFPLSDILDKYMPSDIENIDFMSVDVEGIDLEVLESNNWDKYKPRIIAIESLVSANDIRTSLNSEVAQYLSTKNYVLCSKAENTLLFKRKD